MLGLMIGAALLGIIIAAGIYPGIQLVISLLIYLAVR